MTDVELRMPEAVRRVVDTDPRRAMAVIGVLSVAAVGLIVWLVLGVDVGGDSSSVVMPIVNASLNAAAATFLVLGWRHVRAGRLVAHRNAMLTALGCSAAFLVAYLVHHTVNGDTPFGGTGALRALYLTVLASHVVLSAVGLPFVVATAWSALAGRIDLHRRLARRTLPVWLYVSVTGVVVAVLVVAYA